jgi:hypothetical protein
MEPTCGAPVTKMTSASSCQVWGLVAQSRSFCAWLVTTVKLSCSDGLNSGVIEAVDRVKLSVTATLVAGLPLPPTHWPVVKLSDPMRTSWPVVTLLKRLAAGVNGTILSSAPGSLV